MFSPPVEEVLHFLTELFEANCGYSALNTARSALSTFIVLPENISMGNHPLVIRFLKSGMWPLCYLIWKLSPLAKLSLKDLTCKVTMILMLLSGRRIQTIQKNPKKSNCWNYKINTLSQGGIYKIWNLRLMLPVTGHLATNQLATKWSHLATKRNLLATKPNNLIILNLKPKGLSSTLFSCAVYKTLTLALFLFCGIIMCWTSGSSKIVSYLCKNFGVSCFLNDA